MSRRTLTVLLTALLVSVVCYTRNPQDPHARYVAEAYEEIDRFALVRPNDQDLLAGAMRGMVQVLRDRGDEHSGYIDPSTADRFLADIRQEFGGVGVRIRFNGDPPRLTIAGPPEPATPAAEAGLRSGDLVDAIDGQPTDGMTMNRVLDLMRGPVGEPVVLTISRGINQDLETLTVPLVRAEIEVASVIGDRRVASGEWLFGLEQEPRVALLRITSFGNKTLGELTELLPRLLSDGVEALVIDLRENPGGALDVSIEVCNLFLPPGAPIVETRGRDGQLLSRYEASGGPYLAPPIAVLVNDQSASAAEIMAACLQDNDRAVVVGERSFGKGTVQRITPLESGRSRLKLTSASFWRPIGVNIHRMPDDPEDADWGVRPTPGYEVPLTDEQYTEWRTNRAERDIMTPKDRDQSAEWRDTVLDRALEYVRQGLGD